MSGITTNIIDNIIGFDDDKFNSCLAEIKPDDPIYSRDSNKLLREAVKKFQKSSKGTKTYEHLDALIMKLLENSAVRDAFRVVSKEELSVIQKNYTIRLTKIEGINKYFEWFVFEATDEQWQAYKRSSEFQEIQTQQDRLGKNNLLLQAVKSSSLSSNGILIIVNRLLDVQPICQHAADNNNAVLIKARERGYAAIVQRLESLEGVRQVQLRGGNVASAEIETHTRSIHKSVSESAKKLQSAFGTALPTVPARILDFGSSYIRWILGMDPIERVFQDPEQMKELRALLKLYSKKYKPEDSDAQIKELVYKAFGRVRLNIEGFVDPDSQISLDEILRLVLSGIASIKDTETRQNACLQLCKTMYLLQTEYGKTAACTPGFFNAIVQSQESTLPQYINLYIQTTADAALLLLALMKRFARSVFESNNFENADEFESAVHKQGKSKSIELISKVVTEHYIAYDFDSATEASQTMQNDKERFKEICNQLIGSRNPEDLFDMLPLNFNELFKDLSDERGNAKRARKD